MKRLVVAPNARRDIRSILRHSRETFGRLTEQRYRLLFEQAFSDLQTDPERIGVRSDDALPPDLRFYPLRWSRDRLPASDRVARPRHVIVFRHDAARLQIVRLLHDSMDPARHVSVAGGGR